MDGLQINHAVPFPETLRDSCHGLNHATYVAGFTALGALCGQEVFDYLPDRRQLSFQPQPGQHRSQGQRRALIGRGGGQVLQVEQCFSGG